jgi:hypothetical protein
MNSFLNFLKKNYPSYYKQLAGKSPGSSSFNSAWKQIAKADPSGFDQAQHEFIKQSHYEPARRQIEKELGIDLSKYPKAVHDVLWSTAVQHGAYGAYRVFKNAGIRNGMSPKEIIIRVYDERMADGGLKYFSRSSPSIRRSVVKRFNNEKQDALRMLG